MQEPMQSRLLLKLFEFPPHRPNSNALHVDVVRSNEYRVSVIVDNKPTSLPNRLPPLVPPVGFVQFPSFSGKVHNENGSGTKLKHYSIRSRIYRLLICC